MAIFKITSDGGIWKYQTRNTFNGTVTGQDVWVNPDGAGNIPVGMYDGTNDFNEIEVLLLAQEYETFKNSIKASLMRVFNMRNKALEQTLDESSFFNDPIKMSDKLAYVRAENFFDAEEKAANIFGEGYAKTLDDNPPRTYEDFFNMNYAPAAA